MSLLRPKWDMQKQDLTYAYDAAVTMSPRCAAVLTITNGQKSYSVPLRKPDFLKASTHTHFTHLSFSNLLTVLQATPQQWSRGAKEKHTSRATCTKLQSKVVRLLSATGDYNTVAETAHISHLDFQGSHCSLSRGCLSGNEHTFRPFHQLVIVLRKTHSCCMSWHAADRWQQAISCFYRTAFSSRCRIKCN